MAMDERSQVRLLSGPLVPSACPICDCKAGGISFLRDFLAGVSVQMSVGQIAEW